MAKKQTYDEKSIAILEGLEAVEKDPGMYIGNVTTKGLNHLIYEIVDNSVDEHLAGACDTDKGNSCKKSGSCTVEDNGPCIPCGNVSLRVYLLHVSYSQPCMQEVIRQFCIQDQRRSTRSWFMSVVNALSTYMDVEISRDGYIHHDRYEKGVPVVELENGLLPT